MDNRKKRKFRKNIRHYVDSDYKHKLSEEDTEWLTKFEYEYYDNDHRKPDSLHNIILGDDYTKKIVGKNDHGDEMTLRQAESIRMEKMNQDIMCIFDNTSFLTSYEDLSEEIEQEVKAPELEEKYDLKYSKYVDIMKALLNDLIFAINQPGANQASLIKEYSKKVIELYIQAKRQNAKKRNENYRSKKSK